MHLINYTKGITKILKFYGKTVLNIYHNNLKYYNNLLIYNYYINGLY